MKLNITIPTSLEDITLRQYKKFLKLQEKVTDERLLNAKMIEIFCGIKFEQVMLLKLSDSQEIIDLLLKIFESKPSLVSKFKLNGIEYGFHPELDDLTLGEYIDLDTFIGDWDNMEKAMNVLYRPVLVKMKDKYSIDSYVLENDVLLLDMPMDAVMSSIFFLWNLGLDLSTIMTNSLDNKESQVLTQFLNSQRNGVGINHFMDSLKETLHELKISLN
tara:strand:- start:1546 stop:2196 length:651 start_codon:yes stop_codon:yes gene_type:complete